jgi:hypothetical protein
MAGCNKVLLTNVYRRPILPVWVTAAGLEGKAAKGWEMALELIRNAIKK